MAEKRDFYEVLGVSKTEPHISVTKWSAVWGDGGDSTSMAC